MLQAKICISIQRHITLIQLDRVHFQIKLRSDPVEKSETNFSSYYQKISPDFTKKHSSSQTKAFSEKIKKI